MNGNVAGSVTWKNAFTGVAPRHAAARSLFGAMFATPTIVLISTMKIVVYTMIRTLENSPTPNHSTTGVRQAIDGTKRKNWVYGSKITRTRRIEPINRPIGAAIALPA